MTTSMSDIQNLIEAYAKGPAELRQSVAGLTTAQVRTAASPGKWSPLEVVCHIADFELVYADRMKRVVAEDQPTLFGGDPDQFAARLSYLQRDLEEELTMIEAVRRHVTRYLKTLDTAAFSRVGVHSDDGPLTLATLLKRIAGHIPHHAEFIRQKRTALGADSV
ncbi:MAG: DinB family protein [Planctomycetota bacterium]